MDAVLALVRIRIVQRSFEVIGALMLTAYLFPKQAVVTDLEQFDYIVVGAGSAGAVVAARLAAHHRVLLVDAGGDPPQESLTPGLLEYLPKTRVDWNYTSEDDGYSFQCHQNRRTNMTSGRVLGGGSSVNYMYYVRGCPGDFASWAAAAQDPTWDYNGVLPYFIKSERLCDEVTLNSPQGAYHGTDGFLGVTRQSSRQADKYLESFRELGHDIILDINADSSLGYCQPMFTIKDGVRQSTAYTVLAAEKYNPNLHVLKDTFVTKVVFDDNKNAIGIEALKGDNNRIQLRAKKEVIVSAGGLSTPRLLMLSGIGPKQHLESLNISVVSDLPVGDNLQDHAPIISSITLEKSIEPPPIPDPRTFPYEAITGYVALNKSSSCPDYQSILFIVPNSSPGVLDLCSFNFGYDLDICQNFFDAEKGRRTLFSTISLLHPKSRGRVRLRSAEPTAPPLIYGGYLSDDRDLETIVDSLIDFFKILDTSYFRSINAEMVDLELRSCDGLRFRTREWWRCYARCLITTLYHYSGTCALGSVVDSRLRVEGVRRLRVADASIMPTVVGANTNAATIMIAEKAADFIKQDNALDYTVSDSLFSPYLPNLRWFQK